jgi:hypothetical protein
MKTFVLMVSKHFMKGHPRAGQFTYFSEEIFSGCHLNPHATFSQEIISSGMYHTAIPKIHTIRENYEYWARIAEEVNAGRGFLSLR